MIVTGEEILIIGVAVMFGVVILGVFIPFVWPEIKRFFGRD